MEDIYRHLPVNTEGGQFRVITILPFSTDTRLRCSLRVVCLLDTRPEYAEFVTSTAGSSKTTSEILKA